MHTQYFNIIYMYYTKANFFKIIGLLIMHNYVMTIVKNFVI